MHNVLIYCCLSCHCKKNNKGWASLEGMGIICFHVSGKSKALFFWIFLSLWCVRAWPNPESLIGCKRTDAVRFPHHKPVHFHLISRPLTDTQTWPWCFGAINLTSITLLSSHLTMHSSDSQWCHRFCAVKVCWH